MYPIHIHQTNPASHYELTQLLDDAYAGCDPDFDIAFDGTIEELERQFAERRMQSFNS